MGNVLNGLVDLLPSLEEMHVSLHDVDFVHDCARVSTRAILERHIEDNDAGKVVDRRELVTIAFNGWVIRRILPISDIQAHPTKVDITAKGENWHTRVEWNNDASCIPSLR